MMMDDNRSKCLYGRMFILSLLTFLNLKLGHGSSNNEINQCCKIAFIIIGQSNNYHKQLAETKVQNISYQFDEYKCKKKLIYVVPNNFNDVPGYWTVLPLLPRLQIIADWLWVFFMEDHTVVNLKNLCSVIADYNSTKDNFLGYGLKDSDSTIIHHFDPVEKNILYPHFLVGFIMSRSLIKSAAAIWQKSSKDDFAIDAKYELAKFLLQDEINIAMKHDSRFCIDYEVKCASYLLKDTLCNNNSVLKERVIFAVKTCQKYYESRVQVVKTTWAYDTKHILFFSDTENDSIPTVNLGVLNVEQGHCEKTFALMKYLTSSEYKNFDWVVIADDDTLLSVPRLLQLLSCYNSSEKIALGEKYGFRVTESFGYDYITGGGGMVFSMVLVKEIVQFCVCPNIDSPDDMILGMCLKRLRVPIIHSHLFHQARPNDYSENYITSQAQVSFHKHWNIDPYFVYKKYLNDAFSVPSLHEEL